jgi:NOL1/NOP2/fmu family ribosome biogenesis protein
LEKAVRIFPEDGGEGHFVCAMVRRSEGERREAPGFQPEKHPEAEGALKEMVKNRPEGEWICRGDYYFLVPKDLPCPAGIKILRAGLQALELKGKQWKPTHHLAMCLPVSDFHYTNPLSLQEAHSYLTGQTVACNGKGYGVVTVENTPLGWIKSSGGVGKNHYPKGLRLLK